MIRIVLRQAYHKMNFKKEIKQIGWWIDGEAGGSLSLKSS